MAEKVPYKANLSPLRVLILILTADCAKTTPVKFGRSYLECIGRMYHD